MPFEQCPPPSEYELAARNPKLSVETFSSLQADQYAYWSQFAVDNPHALVRAQVELSMITAGRAETSYAAMLWNQDCKPGPGPEHAERHRRRQLSAMATTLLLRTALANTLLDKSLGIATLSKTIDMYDDRDGIPHDGRLHVRKEIANRVLGRPQGCTVEGVQWYTSSNLRVHAIYPARPTPQQLRVLRAQKHTVDPAGIVTLIPYIPSSKQD